jgi:23S rRNA pseudouridine1911/1915/1917 synthase
MSNEQFSPLPKAALPPPHSPLPTIIDETEDFAVVFKPSRMHSVPLKNGGDTLLDWYAGVFPPVMDLTSRKKGEGGLLHRLDFETQGLVLFAKNQSALDFLQTSQEQGNFIKEYSAIGQKTISMDSSFPPPPFSASTLQKGSAIESYFRPFGPGRKEVRPLTDAVIQGRKAAFKEVAKDQGGYYRTEIVNIVENEHYALSLRLRRGFRHQIRCHLAWIGCPVQNDPVYGTKPADGFLSLRSHALFFTDPRGGNPREYRIEEMKNEK